MDRFHSLGGFCAFLLIAFVLGEARRDIRWRMIAAGVALQFALALLILHVPGMNTIMLSLNNIVLALQQSTEEGSAFVFGFLGGAPLPFEETAEGSSYILAFRVLPLVLVVSALSAVLFHWGVLPFLVNIFARLLQRSLNVSGPIGFAAASSVFLGMVEAPLLVRPYLATMRRGELFAMMTCAMATVAGTVMVVFAVLVEPTVPGAMGHILAASVISVPAALVTAHLMIPAEASAELADIDTARDAASATDALMQGTQQGIRIVLEIAATIIVLFTIVGLVNRGLTAIPAPGDEPLTLQRIFGAAFRPLVWLMGVPWAESAEAGRFMGIKTVLNEFVAYVEFSQAQGGTLSDRSRLLLTYALCGFANFGSFGILVGGLNSIIPERRKELASLGFRAILSGTLATLMTGAVIGVLH